MREFVGVMNRESANLPNTTAIGLLCVSSTITNSLLRCFFRFLTMDRESALSTYPIALIRVMDKAIKSFQPNYSLLRCLPELQFVYDVSSSPVPVS